MKLSIPLKDIMLAPDKRFDPSSFSDKDVIERVKKIYGVITEVMDIAIKDGMVEIEFRDATPEKFKSAMKSLKKGIEEAGQGRFPNALKLFQEVLAVIPENIDARRNMAKVYLERSGEGEAAPERMFADRPEGRLELRHVGQHLCAQRKQPGRGGLLLREMP